MNNIILSDSFLFTTIIIPILISLFIRYISLYDTKKKWIEYINIGNDMIVISLTILAINCRNIKDYGIIAMLAMMIVVIFNLACKSIVRNEKSKAYCIYVVVYDFMGSLMLFASYIYYLGGL